jgi:hypothetical protein
MIKAADRLCGPTTSWGGRFRAIRLITGETRQRLANGTDLNVVGTESITISKPLFPQALKVAD